MVSNRMNFLRCLIMATVACGAFDAFAVQAPNPRGSGATQTAGRGNDSTTVSRSSVSRAAARTNNTRSTPDGALVSKAIRDKVSVSRGAVARTAKNSSSARSATTKNVSRSATSRATAVYNDISKIGGGYAACRESYATCMDQFCANANDTYRRCFCSSRFNEFRNTENALDQAKTLLMRFEDNNLNAVDKTAAEVNAMYSATVGEAAIKNDTSAAAKMLDEIGDLLSGKKKVYSTANVSNSLGVLSFDFNDDIDDIWSDGGNSLFSGISGRNLSDLEGVDLYNAVNKQCMNVVSDSCDNTAIANMARSSYSILITQDCNAYQKSLDKKVESIKQTVRTAEKYLREARLEEYRSHNSADVNECITRVRTALTADTACGANYKRCLDYTGAYINQTTGEPIYSPRLFKLTELISLNGEGADVLKQNDQFNRFLESRKMYATSALDTCRDIANVVWDEFKRTALIEIAQAQDEKIEEVKMSCVGTVADCYNTQSSQLKSFDQNTAKDVVALTLSAASKMCVDKLSACAALFGNGDSCVFDAKTGKLTNSTACGLKELVDFVDAVDTDRIADGCESSLKNYATELCTDSSGYPWKCRLMSRQALRTNLAHMANTYCSTDVVQYSDRYKTLDEMIDYLVDDIAVELSDAMAEQCTSLNGLWVDSEDISSLSGTNYNELSTYYSTVYNNNQTYIADSRTWGRCVENSTRVLCESYNDNSMSGTSLTTYDASSDSCRFSSDWYKQKCTEDLNGIWDGTTCYVMD